MVFIVLGITVLLLFGLAAGVFLRVAIRPSERRLIPLRWALGISGLALLAWIMALSNWMVFEGVTDTVGGRAQPEAVEGSHYFLSGLGEKRTPVTRERFERLKRYHDVSARLLAVTSSIFAAAWLALLLVCRIQFRGREKVDPDPKAAERSWRGSIGEQEDSSVGRPPALSYRVTLPDPPVVIEVEGDVMTIRVSPERGGHGRAADLATAVFTLGLVGILAGIIVRRLFVLRLLQVVFLSGIGWALSIAVGVLLFAVTLREIRRRERSSVLSIGTDRVYIDSSMRIWGSIDVPRAGFNGITVRNLSLWPRNRRFLVSAVFESRARIPFITTSSVQLTRRIMAAVEEFLNRKI